MDDCLVGVRLRPTAQADDYRVGDLELHVGDLVLVETPAESVLGEVRRPKREIPEMKKDRAYPRVLRVATDEEARGYHERRERELRSRVEMRQIGARDTTKVLDGIGPCGRQLCCTSHLRRFDPISVKMAKAQDMPLTDNRLLGNCGRLKCCLLYEFSTYEELRSRLPRVNSPCQANCGTSGCMTGKVRSIRVLKQSVVVGFPDGTQAEVPIDQVTWEGRAHIKPQLES
jgi:cell fate regulator YaaT (PSP1 superfamily)